MSALEKLFNAEQKHRLSDAIAHRTSCRTYADPLSTADWAALSFAAGRYVMPGAHLILTRVEESLFTGTLLTAGRVTGCRAVAVVIASSAVTRSSTRRYTGRVLLSGSRIHEFGHLLDHRHL